MKSLMFAVALAVLSTGAAAASDLKDGTTDTRDPFTFPKGTVSWTGVYVGAHGGYGNMNHSLEASKTSTETTPAFCKEGALSDDGKCYNAGVPAVEASCATGNLKDGKCWTEAVSASPAYCSKDIYIVPTINGKCMGDGWVKHESVSAVPEKEIEGAFNPGAEAVAPQEIADAYVAAVDVSHVASAFIDGLNSNGYFFGGEVGADVQRGKFVFGAKVQYDLNSLETTAGFNLDGSVYDTKITEGDSWAVIGRVGYLVAPEALLYFLGGYGQTEVQVDMLDKSFTHDGWIVGAGAEYALAKNVSFNLEYQHMFGSKETWATEATDGFSLTDEIDSDKVMAGLKLRLNAFGQ